jgi:hypothetical protein
MGFEMVLRFYGSKVLRFGKARPRELEQPNLEPGTSNLEP